MAHQSLRSHAADATELYDLLQRLQAVALSGVGLRAVACIGCLAVGLIEPGAIGKAAICLAVLAGLACVWAMVDYVARESLMELVTLHDLIRPREHSTDSVLAALIEIDDLCQAAGAARSGQDNTQGAEDGTQ